MWLAASSAARHAGTAEWHLCSASRLLQSCRCVVSSTSPAADQRAVVRLGIGRLPSAELAVGPSLDSSGSAGIATGAGPSSELRPHHTASMSD